MGSFLYPNSNGTSYYNVWTRWGAGAFIEFNYISWSEVIDGENALSRSYGVSVGMPFLSLF